ncbi:dentin sialophospho -like [Lecanosticta acicola]|uniref:Dentin sialophospho -like n=1 Tax=Lecanosticta acicola TaxID=111012 RepID=A0AAI9E7Z6_9PEZI|nr:dentin sialophospho -like [Lecanosticta acicola]
MTRPSILRADTLDLQDHDNPTAAEHHKHPTPTTAGNAPNLAAQVNHVLEERHSEELALHDAWNIADNLTDDPSAIDQAQSHNAQDHVTNGASGHENGEEGGEGADTETDADDDMMDRISSSPSIDDGGYPLHSSQASFVDKPRPSRSTSLSPRFTPTPLRESFNQIADMTPLSSPFLHTPQHLPLRGGMVGGVQSPLAEQAAVDYSSPFMDVPAVFPFRPAQKSSSIFLASNHHHMGRYGQDDQSGLPEDTRKAASTHNHNRHHSFFDDASDDEDHTPSSVDLRPIESPFRQNPFEAHTTGLCPPILEESPSFSSITSVDLDTLLLPRDDPLLERVDSPIASVASWDSMLDQQDTDYLTQEFDDAEDAFTDLDDRFIDSGWGGECLREAEDIDFEFVYALHTFVATVEGQANATKGDTMVLLDDSNSYWWLVRVVKDSSIGYLPAEHIETPTERLARLNKHRNIDLSATMLSDNSEKSRNPLKKAMRRRNAKTVQFAAPTYVEASDYDYSTEDEEAMIEPYASALQAADTTVQDEPEPEPEEPKVEVKEPVAEGRSSTSSQRASFDREQAATAAQALAAAGIGGDESGVQPKLVDKTGEFDRFAIDHSTAIPTVATEAAPLKSKKTRNTDSFLKDDSLETRKITLTPGILRDEGSSKSSAESTRNTNSMETISKTVSPPEQPKKETKEKKKEPKKGGMLSGLFKKSKKDKKSKEEATEFDSEKVSLEVSRDSPRASPLTSGKSSPVERNFNGQQTAVAGRGNLHNATSAEEMQQEKPNEPSNGFFAELQGSEVAYEMAAGPEDPVSDLQRRIDTEAAQQEKTKSSNPLSPITNPITNMLKTGDGHDKPKKAKRSKQRVQLDDFDSPRNEETNPFADQEDDSERSSAGERLSESPVEINSGAFMHGTDTIHIPMPGQFEPDEDEEEEDEEEEEGPGSLTSSPSIIEHPAEPVEDEGETAEDNDATPTARSPQPTAATQQEAIVPPVRDQSTDSSSTSSSRHLSLRPSPTVSQQSWNEDSLRAWLEDGSEVRDMLIMINDKTGVQPAAPDHPLMTGLFVEQRKGVQDMMGQLDGLLGSYLRRKGVKY